MNKDQALTLALDALKKYMHGISILNDGPDASDEAHAHSILVESMVLSRAAVTAIEQALSQQDEPVAYRVTDSFGNSFTTTDARTRGALVEPLYAAPVQPKAEPVQEPVMIYHGGFTIDCGEHGHHNMEMLKLIPAGTKLYAAPQARAPLTGNQIEQILESGCVAERCGTKWHVLPYAFAAAIEAAHGIGGGDV